MKKMTKQPLFLPIFCMILVMLVNVIYDVASGNFAFSFFTISLRNGVLYGRLIDKFGDNGLVTALIGQVQGDTLDIDLWIMSCRTFKRQLEQAMFDRLVEACAARGIRRIVGHYYPTAKNLLVRDFYATIGFELVSEAEDGSRTFVYENVSGHQPLCTVIEIRRV